MTNFYMVRHGEPDWHTNECYKFKGHGRDLVGLTDKGMKQAREVAMLLKYKKAELIIASPYTRTMQTAAILSKELQIDIRVEIDLREWQPDLTYEYDTYEQFAQLQEEYDKFGGVYPKGKQKKWECKKNLEKRVNDVLSRYLHYNEVIVVCHEKVIKSQIAHRAVDFCEVIEIIR